MKKITVIKRKEILLIIVAIFFISISLFSFSPVWKNQTATKKVAGDTENYPETNLGEATLVSSNNIEIEEVTEVEESDYFLEERMKRENIYSENIEAYENMMNNSNLSSDQKLIAQNEISNITNEKKTISIAENLIKLKGFEDVVIFKNNEEIDAIIKAENLEENQVAQIQEIIEKEFKVDSKNIIITTK